MGFLRDKMAGHSAKATSLHEAARARLQAVRANKPAEEFNEPLMEFIPRVTPRWVAPHHLAPYVDLLERAPGGGLRVCLSTPPQCSKTETTSHGLVRVVKKHPALRNAYASYSADRSQRVGRNALGIAERAGLHLTTGNLDLWRTAQGGQTLWTSVGGPMTGEPIDGVLIIDDPIKDRKEAESPTVRQNQIDWWHSVAETRLHEGASVIVVMTRWHSGDLVGYLTKECGFQYVNLKAIADERRPAGDNRQPGEALWPAKHPLEKLLKLQRENPWNFASMYQGEPRPRGSALFREVTYYSELPAKGFRVVYGLDLAYSQKTAADFSVLVELWAVPPPRGTGVADKPTNWTFYVTDVIRKQVEAPAFGLVLKSAHSKQRGKFWMYGAAIEKGSAQFLQRSGIPITVVDTGGRDKFQRAQQTSEVWNAGRILVPSDADAHPWVDAFVDEVTNFTGLKDPHDDQVDALVSGVDAAIRGAGVDEMPDRSGGRYS